MGFPANGHLDTTDVVELWRRLVVIGSRDDIDRFLGEVGRRFAALGWRPLRQRERSRWSPSDAEAGRLEWGQVRGGGLGVVLSLLRTSDSRVRSGAFRFPADGSPVEDVPREILRVLTEVIEPAAAAVGLETAHPHFGSISRIDVRTAAALGLVADRGDGRWPLPDAAEGPWRKFVYAGYRGNVAFHADELATWFRANGWTAQAAAALVDRFQRELAFLAEYEDSREEPS